MTKLIDMGTKGKTEAEALKRALAHIPKEGMSSYKLDVVFKETDLSLILILPLTNM